MVTFVCQLETFGTVFSATLKSVLDFDFDQNFDDCTTWLFFEDYIRQCNFARFCFKVCNLNHDELTKSLL